jgi:hypothetical protein
VGPFDAEDQRRRGDAQRERDMLQQCQSAIALSRQHRKEIPEADIDITG